MQSESDTVIVYEEYLEILRDIGGDLASALECIISFALKEERTETNFEDWVYILDTFLDQHKYQINDQNKWDYYQSHPYYNDVERCYQHMLIKFPYLHFQYGQSGGYKAFQEVINIYRHTNPERRLVILKLLVKYWPNHRYGYYQRDQKLAAENSYFFEGYFLGPEFRAVLDPNNEIYTEAWLEIDKERIAEHKAYLDRIAAKTADATQTANNEAVVQPAAQAPSTPPDTTTSP